MATRFTQHSLLPSRQANPYTVWEYYLRSLEAIECLGRRFYNRALLPEDSRFVGMSLLEAEAALEAMRDELDLEVSLALLASFEAEFQIDLRSRVGARKKDKLSKELYLLHRRYSGRVPFDVVLDAWKKNKGHATLIGNLKWLLNVRHWLAHGRYWEKEGIRWSPHSVWEGGRALFDVLPKEFTKLAPV